MQHPPAFIITLERNLQRARHTRQLLEQQGIQADFWFGVDGAQHIKFNPGESVDQRAFSAQTFAQKHPTMIGCYLAHYRLWKHALKHKWERIIVFEDDAVPMPNLKRIMPQILALDNSYEHINLGPHGPPPPIIANQHSLIQHIDWDQNLVRIARHGFGAFGYTVNRSGLQKMVPLMMPIRETIDRQKDRPIWEAGLRAFDLWPQIVISVGGNLITYHSAKAIRKLFLQITQPWIWRANRQLASANSRATRQHTQKCLREHAEPKSRASKPKAQTHSNSIHAFVIRAGDRRGAYDTLSALERSGIHAQIWKGISPKSIQLQPGESIRNRLWMTARFGSSRPAGLIAQYLSHYRLMQHALKHNLERILIMDDGCLPNPCLNTISSRIAALDGSFEFIHLGTRMTPRAIRRQQHEWLTPLHNEYQLVPALDMINIQGGYMVSRAGLQKIIPLLMPIQNDLTGTMERITWIHSIRSFQVWPRAATHVNNIWPTYGIKRANSPLRTLRQPNLIRMVMQRKFGNAILATSRKLNTALRPQKHASSMPQRRTQAFLQYKDTQ